MSTIDTSQTSGQAQPPESRLDRIEAALGAALGINLDQHDDQQVVAARKQRLKDAADKAAELVKAAFVEDAPTIEQRIQKIEQILKSRGAINP